MNEQIKKAIDIIKSAKVILIGAGAGLSTSAGYTYSGERFEKYFSDFEEKYNFHDMYSGGFYPFETENEFWAYWSRNIYYNRYDQPASEVHQKLLQLVKDKDYFVLTTNVDHLFQNNGFDKLRLFYTQGDYGLFQCSMPCHQSTYDNEETIRKMIAEQKNFSVPTELIPKCPKCGENMTLNLRSDDKFVEDSGWHQAAYRYKKFLSSHIDDEIVLLELGVGGNTPGIIKYPFWQMTLDNPKAKYICVNYGEAVTPKQIADRSICINDDIKNFLSLIKN
ncbi:MAG: Sir2 silent information regulator family NAD-dependent deacetylase [Selenomonadaceae bacterium]|nr:Sir2 silent information regulator family NAD-dependent deacetylase [Selenomonadaceae bacterium]